jgi:hypothetical protein
MAFVRRHGEKEAGARSTPLADLARDDERPSWPLPVIADTKGWFTDEPFIDSSLERRLDSETKTSNIFNVENKRGENRIEQVSIKASYFS